MANSVKCNACQQTFTYADWNNYNGGLTSGIVDIDSDIANEVATKKYYYCPSCHKKLRHSSVTDDNAEGTFDILNENGEIVVLTEEGSGSGEIVENIPDAVQIRYSYDPVVFISESETTAQQGLISWKNANGLTMYGTKAMNSTQKGISEAHRLLKLKEIQAKNMGKALKKLRMINGTSLDKFKLAIFGDSVMWGFWTLTDSKYKLGTEEGDESSDYFNDVFVDDYGQTCDFGKHGIYANTIRIPYRMVQALNSVYDNKIEFISKIWTGTTASASSSSAEGGAATHWKASKADLCIINLGINVVTSSFKYGLFKM